MKNTNRRHATHEYIRDASHILGFSYEDLAVFTQSQIRKIAYVAAVPCRITRLLLSTVHCATANKRFYLSVSFGFLVPGFLIPGFKPLRTLCSLRLKTLRLQTSDFQPNFRVFRVFRGSINPLYTFYTIYTVKNPNSKQL